MDYKELRKKLKTPATPGRRRAVLVSTGSFNPVHKGHLQNIDLAAKFLSEKCEIDVLVAYISPSSDIYVSHKLGKELIPFDHRYEMVKLACDDHNSNEKLVPIIIDRWEGSQPFFVPFPQVRQYFEETIHDDFPDENLLVLYVAGADQFNKCRLYKSCFYVGISRLGYEIHGETNIKRNIYVCKEKEYEELYSDISSTAIRDAKYKGQSIDDLTYKSVVDYLQNVVHWF